MTVQEKTMLAVALLSMNFSTWLLITGHQTTAAIGVVFAMWVLLMFVARR